MKGVKWLVVIVIVALALVAAAAAVMAQNEVPPPYAGATNPFSWDDQQAQAAGAAVFKGSCIGCHGPAGDGITQANFNDPEFSEDMEAEPDYYFYVVSEGLLSHGMPSFKATLSEEQRWQVLTYVHTLSAVAPVVKPAPTVEPTEPVAAVPAGTTMQLSIPDRALSGQPLKLIAALKDPNDQPIANVAVSFSYNVTFFANGTLPIGDAVTDATGIAELEYTPRQLGPITIIAAYQTLDAAAPVELVTSASTYHVQIGVALPEISSGQVNFGPPSSMHLDQNDSALNTGFRLPGGIPSWLLLFIGVIGVIWFTYFRVAFQLFRISPGHGEEEDRPNTRLVPVLIMMFVFVVGLVLLLMIATGPNSQLHAM
jgi:mono/diheme cytochrome c family protein